MKPIPISKSNRIMYYTFAVSACFFLFILALDLIAMLNRHDLRFFGNVMEWPYSLVVILFDASCVFFLYALSKRQSKLWRKHEQAKS